MATEPQKEKANNQIITIKNQKEKKKEKEIPKNKATADDNKNGAAFLIVNLPVRQEREQEGDRGWEKDGWVVVVVGGGFFNC